MPSINAFGSSNDFMILIISFNSSFETTKWNYFPAFSAPFPLILISNLFITFVAKLLANPGELSLPKEIATFLVLSLLNYIIKNKKTNQIELFQIYQLY